MKHGDGLDNLLPAAMVLMQLAFGVCFVMWLFWMKLFEDHHAGEPLAPRAPDVRHADAGAAAAAAPPDPRRQAEAAGPDLRRQAAPPPPGAPPDRQPAELTARRPRRADDSSDGDDESFDTRPRPGAAADNIEANPALLRDAVIAEYAQRFRAREREGWVQNSRDLAAAEPTPSVLRAQRMRARMAIP